ncbi:hypothetical protein ABQE69_17230 [Mycolicibacillus trivialis]
MTDATALRLDTVDLAYEFSWHVDQPISTMDEFTKGGVAILVQYDLDDAIISLTRSRPSRADETYSEESPGKNDRLRMWLTGRASVAVASPRTGLFQGLNIKFDGATPWKPQQFLDAVTDPSDHAFLRRILELVQASSRRPAIGNYCHLAFGEYPRGGMFVYPFMRRFPPYKFKVDAGQLAIAGCWKSNFKGVTGHPAFAELASMLGLDHTGPASWSSVSDLDPDKLWEVGERVSRAINA